VTSPRRGHPSAILDGLQTDLPELDIGSMTSDVVALSVSAERLPDTLGRLLHQPGARLADVFATDGDVLTLRTVVALDHDACYLVLESALTEQTMPWLSDVTPGAFVEECELFEQFGLRPPEGHQLNRLVVPPVSAPEHPRLDRHEAPARDTHLAYTVGGHAFEFPVGPVRAAGVESLYLGLVTSGEEVVDVYLHTWHKYRGIERRLQGMTPKQALFLVERGEGLSAISTSVAFARAVESASGSGPSIESVRARGICLELERLYNHAQCAAALAQSTGLAVGQAQGEIALEQLLRLNAAVAGHRYLFGTVDIGTAGRTLDLDALDAMLWRARGELCRLIDALLETNSFVDRLEACGIVAAEDAAALALVGPIARACGHAIDVRVDHPCGGAAVPNLRTAVQDGGDALARLVVRRAEIDQSVRLIDMICAGELDIPTADGEPRGWGLGAAESPRGETLAWVELDEQQRIGRARLRTGSARNWRAFDDAVRSQNVFTDVPIIEASFWLTVAGRVL
jgi:Ni,Fe-hydrogenase III large subunit/Ni,Fe-hydrogenase III component G